MNLKLSLYPDLLSLFFEVKTVKDIDDSIPLSVRPRTERPLLDHALVGREAALAWLGEGSDDKLVVGEPGCGKTFLLYQLTREGGVFFVVSRDRGEIAAAIKSRQPKALIVDDAHTRTNRDLLIDIMQIRMTTGVDFSIVASCWPGNRDDIAEALNLTESRIRRLELLTRPEIVEVINATGIYGPTELICEITDQAEGRPGLAVTLAQLCLRGGVREVILGDALKRSVLKFLGPTVGHRASIILAALSVGGDTGMPIKAIASELRLNVVELWGIVTELAYGGVIWQVDQRHLSVRPARLRHALVRDVFFKGLGVLPIEQLLAQAPDPPQAALTLIGAKDLGAAIPQGLLIDILEKTHSMNAWRGYAGLGHDEASWALNDHPEKLITIGRPALHRAPEVAIPLLLDAAIGDQRPLHSTTEHPLRLIEDWVHAGRPGTGQVFERRKVLSESTQGWLSSRGDIDVGLRAFQSVLSPGFRYHTIDPGMGNTVTIHYGYPSMDEIRAIQSMWSKVLVIIGAVKIVNWEPICRIIETWAYPGRVNVKISNESYDTIRSFAGQMLRDVVSLVKDRSGILHWANRIAKHLGLDEVPLDPIFETLYPVESLEDWRALQEKQRSAVHELATKWSELDPVLVAKRIMLIEQEARSASIEYPRWTPFLCMEIAEVVMSPNTWIRAMIDADSTGDLVGPFLRKAARIDEPGWIELDSICLDRPTLRGSAISVVLTLDDPPENLLAKVLQKLDGYAQSVKLLCLRNQVPESLVRQLLHHEDAAIASAAAQGEWAAEPEGTVRDSLRGDWQEVVIHQVSDDQRLSRMLKGNPSLAQAWIQARLTERESTLFMYENAVSSAVNALSTEGRQCVLHQIPETGEMSELVYCLVDADLSLYRELLSNERLKRLHLVPLANHSEEVGIEPVETWLEKARLALDAGYSIKEVASAVYGYPFIIAFWSGNESDRWAGWVEWFDRLCSHEDERIRKIGEVGKRNAKASQERAFEWERKEAIYGIR